MEKYWISSCIFFNNRFIVCGTKCTENLKALQSTDMIHGDNKVQTRF